MGELPQNVAAYLQANPATIRVADYLRRNSITLVPRYHEHRVQISLEQRTAEGINIFGFIYVGRSSINAVSMGEPFYPGDDINSRKSVMEDLARLYQAGYKKKGKRARHDIALGEIREFFGFPKLKLEELLLWLKGKRHYDGSVLYRAVESLSKQREISQFYDRYILFIKRRKSKMKSMLARISPESAAARNLEVALNYSNPTTQSRWLKAIPKSKRPLLPKIKTE